VFAVFYGHENLLGMAFVRSEGCHGVDVSVSQHLFIVGEHGVGFV